MSRPNVVPWVARWTGEVSADPVVRVGAELHYETGEEDRTLGVLWIRTGVDRSGQPEFAQVNTVRQRTCMLEGLCQVCGEPITGKVIPWIIPALELRAQRIAGRPFMTSTPPTCFPCGLLALEMCPNLSSEAPLLMAVKGYRPIRVFGDVMWPHHVQGDAPLRSTTLDTILARQLVVEIYDYKIQR